jgi:hypothetical protein
MKRSLLAAAAMLLMATTAPAKELLTSGYWKSYVTEGNDGKTPICGVQTEIQNRARTLSGTILVKYQRGGSGIFIQLFKSNWRFSTNKVPVKASVSFDSTRLNAEGTAYIDRLPDGSPVSYVEFWVVRSYSAGFVREFADSNRMLFEFPDGDEPNWTASLAGSREAAKVFVNCVKYYGGIPRDPEVSTQPFGKPAAPTQPYGRSPTQPFGTSKPVTAKPDNGSI